MYLPQILVCQVGVMWTQKKAMLERLNSKKNVIVNMMDALGNFVKYLFYPPALISALVMAIAVVDFVRYRDSFSQ